MAEEINALALLHAVVRLVPCGTDGADNPHHRGTAKTISKLTAAEIRATLVLEESWSASELFDVVDSLMAEFYGTDAWVALFEGAWGGSAKSKLPKLSADSWLSDYVALSASQQQSVMLWMFKQLTPVEVGSRIGGDGGSSSSSGAVSAAGGRRTAVQVAAPGAVAAVAAAAPVAGTAAAAAVVTATAGEEEENLVAVEVLQRAAKRIGDAAVYAVLGQFHGVVNGAVLASSLMDALPQDVQGRAARTLLGSWVMTELRRTTELASAVALAQAQGNSKRKGIDEERAGSSRREKRKKKKKRKKRREDKDGDSDDDAGKVKLHLSDFCSEWPELPITYDATLKDRLQWLANGSVGKVVQSRPFLKLSSREVVRLSSDMLCGVTGPKTVGAFRLQLQAIRELTSSERGLRKQVTFHAFLIHVSEGVQEWHDASMMDSCLMQELPIFLARWETSVERACKGITKISVKKARKLAKAIKKDMTQQANSRAVTLGGIPALLWTSKSHKGKSPAACAKHVGKVEGVAGFERGCGKTAAVCGLPHINRQQDPQAFAEALRFISLAWPDGRASAN